MTHENNERRALIQCNMVTVSNKLNGIKDDILLLLTLGPWMLTSILLLSELVQSHTTGYVQMIIIPDITLDIISNNLIRKKEIRKQVELNSRIRISIFNT